MMLGDLGARVIKVESPGAAATTPAAGGRRSCSPSTATGSPPTSCATNRNKESITLDLKDDGDKAVLTELLRRADVLLENFRPGTLDRLGFGTAVLAELNPRLVTLSISGFGHDGPEGGRAGYDQIAQGEAGLMSLTGSGPDDPQRVGVPIGDLLAGMYGAYGVLAALLERERTGRGQVVRTSLLAAIVGVHAFQGTAWTVAGKVGRAQGNHHPSIAPYGLFPAPTAACSSPAATSRCGGSCAPSSASTRRRRAWRPTASGSSTATEVIALLERTFADIAAADLLARLTAAGHPGGQGAHDRRGLRAGTRRCSQGLLVDVEHATLGRLQLPGPPLRFFTPGPDGETETTRREHAAPPVLGADGDAIRAEVAAWRSGRDPTSTARDPVRRGRPDAARPRARRRARGRRGTPRSPRATVDPEYARELAGAAESAAAGRGRSSPARARCAAAGWPWSPASSASWPARSGWPPPSG